MTDFGVSAALPATRDRHLVFVDPVFQSEQILSAGLLSTEQPDSADIAVISASADRNLIRSACHDPFKPVIVVGEGNEFDELKSSDLAFDNLQPVLDRATGIAKRYAELRSTVPSASLSLPMNALLAFAWTRFNRISVMFSPKLKRGSAYHASRVLVSEPGTQPPDPVTLLAEMARSGFLSSELVDIAHPCPDCGSINVLLRDGCPKCGCIDIIDLPLIHHFDCAFQAEESQFLGPHGIYTCPKCRKELRHFGFDYDKPGQVHVCAECNHRATEVQALGRCLSCGLKFPAEDSPRLRIHDYVLTAEGTHALFSGMAQTDPITSILGKRLPLLPLPMLTVVAQKMMAIEERHHLQTLALIIDLTKIKQIPQGAGMEIQFFVRFGSELANLVRSTDIVAYHLGRLILLLPGADLERGRFVETRLKRALGDIFEHDVIDGAGFQFHSIGDCLQHGLGWAA